MADKDSYEIRHMTGQDLETAIEWAAKEGWNPGLADARSFQAADRNGFLVGLLDGEPVASISAVSYGTEFAFIGMYIVRPDMRGRGYGWRIWQAAMGQVNGIPTGLDFQKDSYGPFAPTLKRHLARLQNNGLAIEQQTGNMFIVRVGPTYRDAVTSYRDCMEQWRPAVDRTVDLMARMNTKTAEVAATVHFTAAALADEYGRRPTATEVITSVEQWKIRRTPKVERSDIVDALAVLGLRGWLDVELDDEAAEMVDELVDS